MCLTDKQWATQWKRMERISKFLRLLGMLWSTWDLVNRLVHINSSQSSNYTSLTLVVFNIPCTWLRTSCWSCWWCKVNSGSVQLLTAQLATLPSFSPSLISIHFPVSEMIQEDLLLHLESLKTRITLKRWKIYPLAWIQIMLRNAFRPGDEILLHPDTSTFLNPKYWLDHPENTYFHYLNIFSGSKYSKTILFNNRSTIRHVDCG